MTGLDVHAGVDLFVESWKHFDLAANRPKAGPGRRKKAAGKGKENTSSTAMAPADDDDGRVLKVD